MKKFWSLFVLLLPLQAIAEIQLSRADDLPFIVQKIEENYAGFDDKVPEAKRAAYKDLTNNLLQKIKNQTPEAATATIEEWLAFFKDKHIWYTAAVAEVQQRETKRSKAEFYIKKLSSKTILLRLPHFDFTSKDVIDKLLKEHARDLSIIDNLIIDLQNNGGGSDTSYQEVLKLIYSRPIYQIGAQIKSTPDNISSFEGFLADPDFPEDNKPFIKTLITSLKAHPGKFVNIGDDQVHIITFPQILPRPRRVGIVITGAGSSGEQFVLEARQSRKTTLFGGPTHGVLDYSNVNSLKTPSGGMLYYPTSRSLRLPAEPVDGVGIQPDILISKSEKDPIAVAQKWLEKQAND